MSLKGGRPTRPSDASILSSYSPELPVSLVASPFHRGLSYAWIWVHYFKIEKIGIVTR